MTELEWKIAAAIDRGHHVTTKSVCGMTCAIFHGQTNEDRQTAINEFEAYETGVENKVKVDG